MDTIRKLALQDFSKMEVFKCWEITFAEVKEIQDNEAEELMWTPHEVEQHAKPSAIAPTRKTTEQVGKARLWVCSEHHGHHFEGELEDRPSVLRDAVLLVQEASSGRFWNNWSNGRGLCWNGLKNPKRAEFSALLTLRGCIFHCQAS